MANITYAVGTLTTLLDNTGSAPNTLAAVAASKGAAISLTIFDNTPATGAMAFWGDFELAFTYGSAPAAGGTLDLYLIESIDGANYSDGTGSNTPASVVAPQSSYIGSLPVQAIATAQRLILRGVPLPPTKFTLMVVNNATTALKTSGTAQTLKILPYYQQVN